MLHENENTYWTYLDIFHGRFCIYQGPYYTSVLPDRLRGIWSKQAMLWMFVDNIAVLGRQNSHNSGRLRYQFSSRYNRCRSCRLGGQRRFGVCLLCIPAWYSFGQIWLCSSSHRRGGDKDWFILLMFCIDMCVVFSGFNDLCEVIVYFWGAIGEFPAKFTGFVCNKNFAFVNSI